MFFFKQKTAYDMRISDWSSDVCSSDLEHTGGAIRLEDDGVVRCAEGRADSHPRSAAEEAGEELDLIAATLEPADHMEGGLCGASGGIGGGAEDELVRPITADHSIAAGAHRGPGSTHRAIAGANGHGGYAGEATDQRAVDAAAQQDVTTAAAVKKA